MHAAVRMYQVDPDKVDEFKQLVNETFLPIIEEAPGFRAYYALDAGGGRIASISVFDDRAGAEEFTRMASENIRKNIASLAPNPPEVLEGEVYANAAALGGTVGRDDGHGGWHHGQPPGWRGEEELAKGSHSPPRRGGPRRCARAGAVGPGDRTGRRIRPVPTACPVRK